LSGSEYVGHTHYETTNQRCCQIAKLANLGNVGILKLSHN